MYLTNRLAKPAMEPQAKKSFFTLNNLLLLCLFAAIEMVFVNPGFSTFLGPIIAVLLLYTYFVMHETVLTTVIIVLANDGLGTIFLGQLSFQYLLLIFIFFGVFTHKKIKVRSLVLTLVATVLCGQLVLVGDIAFRQAFYALLYVGILFVQFSKYKDDQSAFFEKLCNALAISVSLIALHAVITGGVEYYELNQYSEEFLRKGILGVGNGDSNFSSLCLCTGIVGALNSKNFPRLVRVGLVVLMVCALAVTVSITGLLALLAVLLFHFAANKKAYKAIGIILLIAVLLVVLYNVYVSLPSSARIDTVDAYIDRITDVLDELESGDLIEATSSRSGIAKKYIRYIFTEQSPIKMMFGGNGVMAAGGVPHNTYLDWTLQFGLVGALALIAYAVYRLVLLCKSTVPADTKKMLIMLKSLYLLFAFSLSIYDGAMFGTMFFFLFFL